MLAAAIADLELDTGGRGEQRVRIERAVGQRQLKLGQFLAEQPVLPLVQPLAGAPTEKGARLAVDVERVVRLVVGQRKAPSPGGLRPPTSPPRER